MYAGEFFYAVLIQSICEVPLNVLSIIKRVAAVEAA